jgi:3-oxoacyl-(acyl-carrier-protein) synthase
VWSLRELDINNFIIKTPRTIDSICGIDCAPNKARVKRVYPVRKFGCDFKPSTQLETMSSNGVNIALNNGFAFGGNNSCLVIGKFS